MQAIKIGLLAMCCAGLLAACGTPAPPQIEIKPPPMPPARLMECPAAPQIPDKEPLMETDVAFLLRDFFAAHRICRARLQGLAQFVRDTHGN